MQKEKLMNQLLSTTLQNRETLYEMYEVDKKVINDSFDIEMFLEFINCYETNQIYEQFMEVNKVLVIYDGDPDITFKAIMTAIEYNISDMVLFPNKRFLGVNHYLTTCFNSLESNIHIALDFDDSISHYFPYKNQFERIFYIGDIDGFLSVEETFKKDVYFIEEY